VASKVEPRHPSGGIHRRAVAGGLAVDIFESYTDIEVHALVDRPVVLRVPGTGGDVEARAAGREPVFDERLAGNEDRDQPVLRVEHRIAAGIGLIVGIEHVIVRRLRVAAGAPCPEMLEPGLEVVAAGPIGGEEVRHRSRQLFVVAILGVGRVEVRRVVMSEILRQRDERRAKDVGAGAAGAAKAEPLLRVLRGREQPRAEHTAPVGVVRPVDAFADLEGRLRGPGVVGQVDPQRAAEVVAAALGDGVDDTAGEAAELGRGAGGDHLRFGNRVFDEEIVRGAEQIVVHVDAVDQEHVVVGERAGLPQRNRAMRPCIDAGQSCHDVCLRMIRHCLA
jgi:hypothetical protein